MASKSKKKSKKKKSEKLNLKKTVETSQTSKKISGSLTTLTEGALPLQIMTTIANFGETIIFGVSQKKLLTFSDFNRTVSGRWNVHDAIGKRGKTEFVGPELANGTMTVVLDAAYGVDPRKIIESIEDAVFKGTAEYLVIGGKKVGAKKMRITEMSETWDEIFNNGALYKATLNLTFDDYVK